MNDLLSVSIFTVFQDHVKEWSTKYEFLNIHVRFTDHSAGLLQSSVFHECEGDGTWAGCQRSARRVTFACSLGP